MNVQKTFGQNVPFKGENERWALPIISSNENDSIIVTNLESYPLLHFWIPLSKRISQQKGGRAWKSQDDFGIKVSRSEKADLFNGHLLQCYAIIIYVQLQVNIPIQFHNSYKRIASVLSSKVLPRMFRCFPAKIYTRGIPWNPSWNPWSISGTSHPSNYYFFHPRISRTIWQTQGM